MKDLEAAAHLLTLVNHSVPIISIAIPALTLVAPGARVLELANKRAPWIAPVWPHCLAQTCVPASQVALPAITLAAVAGVLLLMEGKEAVWMWISLFAVACLLTLANQPLLLPLRLEVLMEALL